MGECVFDIILLEWAESEWEEYADAPGFKTSKKHDRAMKRIFKLYDKNTRHLRPQSEIKTREIRRRIMVALIVIILAVITGFTAAYFISQSFRGEVHKDNTELFPINIENCPTFIENEYYLSELPTGFEKTSTRLNPYSMAVMYENNKTGQTITFEQWVKPGFDSMRFNNEKGSLIEVEINGHNGVILENSDNKNYCDLIWDNGDYILHIYGDLPKNELMNLAKNAKLL